MRLVVTGGGTGGHVFPAIEVARQAQGSGWEVVYLGSIRGQEGNACRRIDLPFQGFPSEPLYRLTSLRGAKAAIKLIKATSMARNALEAFRPGVVFSTGGYASAPVVQAAKSLGIPFVLHEQNTVPGRTNRILSRRAARVATVFKSGAEHFPGVKVVRTGMPIRKELRCSAQGTFGLGQSLGTNDPILLVMGGSQGAAALNDAALATAVRMAATDVHWLHIAGMSHFESTLESMKKLAINSRYEVKAYVEAEEMASALFSTSLAISRSGAGTLAELAAFRKPSILVPYPHAFGQHQLINAQEFESIGASIIVAQKDLQASTLEARIRLWLHDDSMRTRAEQALADWDIPDAVPRLIELLEDAAR